MGLRDRIISAVTGTPAPTDRRSRPIRDDGRSPRARRPGQNRINSSASVPKAGRRPPQLAMEGISASMSEPQSRSGKLVIQASSASTPAKTPRQNSPNGSITNISSRRALPEATASTPALPLARISRPYAGSGNREAFALNPSRRSVINDTSCSSATASTPSPRATNLPRVTTAIGARKNEGDEELAPLSEREIIDISDEDNSSPAGANTRVQIRDGAQQNRPQHTSRASNPAAPVPTPQRNDHSSMMPSSELFGNRKAGDTNSCQSRRGASEPSSQPRSAYQPPKPSQANSSGPVVIINQASSGDTEQPSALYLGVFDREQTNHAAQQPAPSNRGGSSRYGISRPSSFDQQSNFNSTSTSSHWTTVTSHGYGFGSSFYPFGARSFYSPVYGYGWGWNPYWDYLPWYPCVHVALPSQTIFTEVSTDYFEQDFPATPNHDTNTGLEFLNRYYNGWRDAYTQALSLSGSGGISEADRARIEGYRQKLQGRQDEAIRRLRSGDQTVVQETLDQVKMDRRMAVDMPAEQIRWATPWIREVWVEEHGEVWGGF